MEQVGQATVIVFIFTIITGNGIAEEHVSESVYIKVWEGWTQTDLRSKAPPLDIFNIH